LRVVGWASLAATAAAVATLLKGRTLILWPSLAWAGAFVTVLVAMFALWAAGHRIRRLLGARETLFASGLPLLALFDGFIVLAFVYLNDGTNHMLARRLLPGNLIVQPEFHTFLLAKFALLLAVWVGAAFWKGRARPDQPSEGDGHSIASAPLLVALLLLAGLYLRLDLFEPLAVETPSDLRVNYVAALAIREGLNPYDNASALAIAGKFGIPYVGTETWTVVTNPPTAMPFFVALSGLSLGRAHDALVWIDQVFLAVALVLIYLAARPRRVLPWTALMLAAVVAFDPIAKAMRLGQVDLAILFLLALSAYLLAKRHDAWAGVAVGVAAGFKIVPAGLILYFLWRRNWKAVGGLLAGGAAMVLLALWIVGPETWRFYLFERLPELLSGTGLWNNLSIPGMLDRFALGTRLAREYWSELPSIPMAAALGYFWTLVVLAAAGLALARSRPRADAMPLELGVATAAALLAAGVAWPHYAAWLLPAIGFLVARVVGGGRGAGYGSASLVGAGAALVAFPYSDHFGLLGGFYDSSVLAMSLGNLGLIATFGGLGLALGESSPWRG